MVLSIWRVSGQTSLHSWTKVRKESCHLFYLSSTYRKEFTFSSSTFRKEFISSKCIINSSYYNVIGLCWSFSSIQIEWYTNWTKVALKSMISKLWLLNTLNFEGYFRSLFSFNWREYFITSQLRINCEVEKGTQRS